MARQCDCRAQMESKKTLKKIAKQAFQFHGAEALSTPRAQLPEENEMDEEREVMETIGEEDEFSS